MELRVINKNNELIDRVEIPEEMANYPVKNHVMWQTVRWQLAKNRRGTHAVKARSDVRGGGRKPWSQKHTGRARQGSIRAPQWVGGGAVFGPNHRNYYFSLPKKIRKVALKSAFASKLKEDEIIIIEDFSFDEPKTKKALEILRKLGINDKKVLIIANEINENIFKSFRNISNVKLLPVSGLNVYDLLNCDICIIFKSSLPDVKERLLK